MKMMENDNFLKHQWSKGTQAVTRLLLLAACTNSQENRFDIPESKSNRDTRPRHAQKANA
jgi:hypothetical protein